MAFLPKDHPKTWTAAVGTILNMAVLLSEQARPFLPPQWTAILSGVIGLLTVVGVYRVPSPPKVPATPTVAGSPWPAS